MAVRPSILEGSSRQSRAQGPSRLTLWALGLGLFLFSLPHFAVASFPYDHLAEWIAQQVEAPPTRGGRARPSGWTLDFVELSPSFPLGLRAQGVTVGRVVEGQGRPAELFVEEAEVQLSVLPLLWGTVSGELEARLAGGELSATFEQDGEARSVHLELKGVRLRRVGLLRAAVPIPVRGTLGGTVDLAWPGDPSKASGRIALRIEMLSVGDGEAKLPVPGMADGITLERVDAGTLQLEASVEEGLVRIETLEAEGPDMHLQVVGTARLARRARASRLDVMARVAFSDAFRNRSDRTRAIFSLLEFSPQLRRARTKDDALQWRITGSLGGRLSTRPAGKQRFEAPRGKRSGRKAGAK